ncbi:MAG: ABC transporter permease [Proteobacteria bacterium]|nr:ABC transporter permease [Pseudomonadota bacterium]HQR02822.1 ABC transporter permease [Rhodocyclaceae bacterium]
MASIKPLAWPRIAWLPLAALVFAALIAPWLAPQNPYDLVTLDLLDARLPPGSHAGTGTLTYLLGSDEQGRDMLSAILYGLRISLVVGLAGSGGGALLGVPLGLIAAQVGGRIDGLIMRIADLQLSFPALLLALVLLALLGPGLGKVVLALIAVQWAYFARSTRATALVELGKDYITAARGLGLNPLRISLRHILPNCLPPLLTLLPLQIAAAINLEATLSFLGLGAPVTEPSLGLLMANGFQYLLAGQYWISIYPGIALLGTIMGIHIATGRRGAEYT